MKKESSVLCIRTETWMFCLLSETNVKSKGEEWFETAFEIKLDVSERSAKEGVALPVKQELMECDRVQVNFRCG